MSSTQARPGAAGTTGLAASLAAAIDELPSFIRAPIFMPTERMTGADAIAGLARVRALYEYDLDLTYRPRLRALKAARAKRRCFIIGNGPSLARTDLSKLANEVTFATNGFFLKMGELSWSPTYYVVEDHLVGEDRAAELTALSGTTKLFPASLAYALPPDKDTIYFDHRPRISYPDGFDFSFDADVITYTGGTVTFTCMQLAAYVGFQEIYLIGVDADYSIPADATVSGDGRVKEIDMRSDDPNHFHPDYFGKGRRWHEPNVDVMLGAYAEARRATEARGVTIVNATVGGKLEVFPRVDFEMLFRPAPVERLLVIDHTRMGNGTATGELKFAILGNWPPHLLMQVHDSGDGTGQLQVDGPQGAADDADSVVRRIEAFDPDLVLYRPVPRTEAIHDVAVELVARTNLPLAVWIVDDWPTAYSLEDPGRAAHLEADFRWLLARADARFSIGSSMSAAFHERYGKPFVPLANGVDPADWEPARLRTTSPIKVRYAGSLAENMTLASVGLVARAVEKLANGGLDIELEIKTHRHWQAASLGWVTGFQHTSVSTSDLTLLDYRRWLAEADILLIAYNFDARSRDYIRYSLSNKLPECLASGAPVLAVGPDDVSTMIAMAELGVGERVTLADEELIGETLRRLAASPEARFELAQRAQAVAFSLFDVRQTRQAFEAGVGRVAAAHRSGEYPRDLHAHVDEGAVVSSLLEDRRGPSHVMIDVGAHRGSSAIHFDRLGWRIHCFEPHPKSREALGKRFAGHDNVRIDPRALSDAPASKVPLYESPESSGIATLKPFHPSHRPAVNVDVTTIAAVAGELELSNVDFLKIDVEGLDITVLRGVPWARLRPDVIESEFQAGRAPEVGNSWLDMGVLLRDQGYAVYVSEWHPVLRYGERHDWRRIRPFSEQLDVGPAAWGNLLAFREDPGWEKVRLAFDRHVERGEARRVPPQPRIRPAIGQPAPARMPTTAGPSTPGSALGRSAPSLRGTRRLARRAARRLWRRRSVTIPLAAILSIWMLAGFIPALAPAAWLIWSLGVLWTTLVGVAYAAYRVRRSVRGMPREIARLRRLEVAQRKRFADANDRIRRLERAVADGARMHADLSLRVGGLEATLPGPATAAKPEPADQEGPSRTIG